jgi:hypothetical protein
LAILLLFKLLALELNMLKALVTINHWAVVRSVSSRNFEELNTGTRLMGYVTGLAHIPSSMLVITSPVLRVDLNHGVVETINTVYRLGEASAEYKSWVNRRRAAAA